MLRPTPQPSRGIVPVVLMASVVAVVAVGASRGLWAPNLHNGLLALACTGVGAAVLWERPGHRVGVLLLGTGAVQAVMFTGRQFGHRPAGDGSAWLAWLGVWPLAVALSLITLAVIVYPDGRLPGPAWSWVVRAVGTIGGPERLHPIGSWPEAAAGGAPAALADLALAPGTSARSISGNGEAARTLGALTVTHPGGAGLSRNEERLLDDLAAQASLVLANLDLAGVIERERAAGHLEDLTPRERDVLDLMARGVSNQVIASELHLSIKTVEPLVSSIFSKLELQQDGASNRRVLAVLAYLRA